MIMVPSAVADARRPAPRFTAGAAGIGDPYFPDDGNGGYDVAHYNLAVRYDPGTGVLVGVTDIEAIATQNLSQFNLDLKGLTVRSVTVGQAPTEARGTRCRSRLDTEKERTDRDTVHRCAGGDPVLHPGGI
jgi:aminopeptidase N